MPQESKGRVPDDFYRTIPGDHWDSVSPGIPDFGRFFNGEDNWWCLPGEGQKQSKYTLILADWTAGNWFPGQIKQIKEKTAQLLDDPFTIYIWQNGSSFKLTKESLHCLDNVRIREKMTIAPSNDFIREAVAKQHHLAYDQLKVVDDYWMDILLNLDSARPRGRLEKKEQKGQEAKHIDKNSEAKEKQGIDSPKVAEDKPPRRLRVSDYGWYAEKYRAYPKKVKRLLTILQKSEPPLSIIVNDEFSESARKTSEVLRSQLPKMKTENMFRSLSLCESQLLELRDKKQLTRNEEVILSLDDFATVTNLELIHCKKIDLPANLTSIKSLKIDRFPLKDLGIYISAIPELLKLEIGKHISIYDDERTIGIPLDEGTINALRNLEEIAISTQALGQTAATILNSSPQLKKITITGLSSFFPMKLNLPNLEELAFVGRESLLVARIIEFIAGAPHLKILDLTGASWYEKKGRALLHEPAALIKELQPKLKGVKIIVSKKAKQKLSQNVSGASYRKGQENSSSSSLLLDDFLLEEEMSNDDDLQDNFQEEEEGPDHKEESSSLEEPSNDNLQNDLQEAKPTSSLPQSLPESPDPAHPKEEKKEDASSQLPQDTPVHRPKDMLDFKPAKSFEFKDPITKDKNQDMIIQKLSQYLTLKKEDLDLIPEIQNGICKALACFFIKKKMDCTLWNVFLEPIQTWNGQSSSLTPEREASLNQIRQAIKSPILQQRHYMGDNSDHLRKLFQDRKPHVLENPWHAIAIVPAEEKGWILYDSECRHGAQAVDTPDHLLNLVKTQLGTLISVSLPLGVTPPDYVRPLIADSDSFIEVGGLLALWRAHYKDKKSMHRQLKSAINRDALEGLLLRDMKGIPAWVCALKDPILSEYTLDLLQCYSRWEDKQRFIKSIENLTPPQLRELMSFLHQLKEKPGQLPEKRNLLDQLATLPSESLTKYYAGELQKRRRDSRNSQCSIEEYTKTILQSADDQRNHLIEFSSETDLQGFYYAFQRHCKNNKRPVFPVRSQKNLICLTRWVKRDEKEPNKGKVQKGLGGPLYQFLKLNQDNRPIFLVKCSDFKARDIVRSNPVLDKNPSIDGEPLPKGTKVIALVNIKKPGYYNGQDFYRRFQKVERCPVPSDELTVPALPIVRKSKAPQNVIKLYDGINWEQRLFGSWGIEEGQLFFEEGSLVPALLQGPDPILGMQKAPWDEAEFDDRWHQAYLDGFIEHQSRRIEIPENLQLMPIDNYEWEMLTPSISFSPGITNLDVPVLNPTLFNHFFDHYECNNSSQAFYKAKGWIEKNKGEKPSVKELHINVTRSLSEGQWAMLLDHCCKHHVKLIAHTAPAIVLPPGLAQAREEAKEEKTLEWPPHTRIIKSNDLDYSVMQVKESKDHWKVIDISECKASDLLTHISGTIDEKTQEVRANQSDGVLLTLLEEKQNVILKGTFSQPLPDALTDLLLKRAREKNSPGQLVLMSSDTSVFQYCSVTEHRVGVSEKKAYLKIKGIREEQVRALSESLLQKESCSQLEARCLQEGDPWAGMLDLKPMVFNQEIDFKNSQALAEKVDLERLKAVNQMLAKMPYAFITGLTAVGKSTFMDKIFIEHLLEEENPPGSFYQGRSQIKNWAKDNSPGRKILFLDEITLSEYLGSDVEGLFESPPHILINGELGKPKELYPLTPKHKIIFAGNPVSYSVDRQLAPLFKRHGGAVLFNPLPPEYIYERILKPLFLGTTIDPYIQETVCRHILEVYQFLVTLSKEDVLISPRELEEMVLLTLAHGTDYIKAAQHYAYVIGNQLVQKVILDKRSKSPDPKELFKQKFQPRSPLKQLPPRQHKNFTITPSRVEVVQLVDDLLHLRSWRQEQKEEGRCYGGLGGITLEGPPDTGKSALVVNRLLAAGYEEIRYPGSANGKKDIFYKMPASMNEQDQKDFLLEKFHEGAVVMRDEANSSFTLEETLNPLLMGKTPKSDRPRRPGFMLIDTQNPATTMPGRIAASTASSRRMITFSLPLYSPEEITQVLIGERVSKGQASLVAEAREQVKSGQSKDETPPSIEDLLWLAGREQLLTAPSQEKDSKESIISSSVTKYSSSPFSSNSQGHLFSSSSTVGVMSVLSLSSSSSVSMSSSSASQLVAESSRSQEKARANAPDFSTSFLSHSNPSSSQAASFLIPSANSQGSIASPSLLSRSESHRQPSIPLNNLNSFLSRIGTSSSSSSLSQAAVLSSETAHSSSSETSSLKPSAMSSSSSS